MSDNNNLTLNSDPKKTSEEKYQYKPGTILYEEDIHYNTTHQHNINTKLSNQESIKQILENYKKNNIPRLYEEDVYPV